ncbi:MAG TPA: hypothetical protein DEG88_06275 [Propionibacteriaceae bacterium]|jgi:hypothetical protein|nr:hypothetical protein [Propionibacteriaceae bacterium]HBY22890.1 hypothetical protein [Propionibacteriaceae bacterium]
MADEKPIQGKVMDMKTVVAAPEAFDALTRLVDTAGKYVAIHAEESRKREALRTYRDTEIATIRAAEVTLQRYFDEAFRERREVFQSLFRAMDHALETGDTQGLNAVVSGIVDVAKDSPLAAAGDLSKLRAAFDDPNQVWSF